MRVWGLVLLGVVASSVSLYALMALGWRGLLIGVGAYIAYAALVSVLLGAED